MKTASFCCGALLLHAGPLTTILAGEAASVVRHEEDDDPPQNEADVLDEVHDGHVTSQVLLLLRLLVHLWQLNQSQRFTVNVAVGVMKYCA